LHGRDGGDDLDSASGYRHDCDGDSDVQVSGGDVRRDTGILSYAQNDKANHGHPDKP
jgi:hypothetical protein